MKVKIRNKLFLICVSYEVVCAWFALTLENQLQIKTHVNLIIGSRCFIIITNDGLLGTFTFALHTIVSLFPSQLLSDYEHRKRL